MIANSQKIKVHLFFRRPVAGDHFSIERLFNAIAGSIPADRFEVRRLVCPFESKGALRRIAIMIWAACNQGDINHITGDVNFLGLLMRRQRTILTIHDSASMLRLAGIRRWLYRLLWLRLPISRAGVVTVISDQTLDETVEFAGAGREKMVVIPNCLTMEVAENPRPWPKDTPRLLVVGTKPNKNVVRIIKALQGIPCKLVVIGALHCEHEAAIAEAGVDVESYVRLKDIEVWQQYQLADAVLFVSTYEGFGLPILEAQAAGRPLITSRRSPMQEVAGEGGCLVDPESIDEIRDAVLRVVNDCVYREVLIDAGSENVKKYSPQVVARRYTAVYQRMIEGRKS